MATKEAKEKEASKEKHANVESNKEKMKILQLTIDKLEKAYGKGTIMKMQADAPIEKVDAIPTGSLGLDVALGVGGFPRGRIIEIYDRNHPERQPFHYILSLRPRKRAALLPLSMRSMHLIVHMQKN